MIIILSNRPTMHYLQLLMYIYNFNIFKNMSTMADKWSTAIIVKNDFKIFFISANGSEKAALHCYQTDGNDCENERGFCKYGNFSENVSVNNPVIGLDLKYIPLFHLSGYYNIYKSSFHIWITEIANGKHCVSYMKQKCTKIWLMWVEEICLSKWRRYRDTLSFLKTKHSSNIVCVEFIGGTCTAVSS